MANNTGPPFYNESNIRIYSNSLITKNHKLPTTQGVQSSGPWSLKTLTTQEMNANYRENKHRGGETTFLVRPIFEL